MFHEEMTSKMQSSAVNEPLTEKTWDQEDLGMRLSCFCCENKMADTSLVSRVRTTAGTR